MRRLRLWILALPFFLYFLGAGMNLLVVTANGSMPVVIPETVRQLAATGDDPSQFDPGKAMDEVHTVYDPKHVRLVALIDWIQVPRLGVVSPGDCLLWLGDWMQPYFVAGWLALLLMGKEKE